MSADATTSIRPTAARRRDRTVRAITRDQLFIESLDTVNHDAADFHEVAVWSVRAALEAAYEAGRRSEKRS